MDDISFQLMELNDSDIDIINKFVPKNNSESDAGAQPRQGRVHHEATYTCSNNFDKLKRHILPDDQGVSVR